MQSDDDNEEFINFIFLLESHQTWYGLQQCGAILSRIRHPVVSLVKSVRLAGREKGEHEQTEKHINPKLCAEIERTCARLRTSQTGGIFEYSCVREIQFSTYALGGRG